MSIKILTQNSIQVTNIDGARENNFSAGNRSGIIKGAFNQGNFFNASSNVIALDSCELLISGHRVVIDSAESITLNNRPVSPTRYSMVAEIVVDNSSTPTFRLFIQNSSIALRQENLYKTANGAGTYQVEIGKFTLTTSGIITDVVRTVDIITGGKGDIDSGVINIGNITTNTLDAGMEAEFDIEQRYDADTMKTYTDFNVSIPRGEQGSPNTLTIGSVESGKVASATITGGAPNQVLNLVLPKGDKGDRGEQGQSGETSIPFIGTFSSLVLDGAISDTGVEIDKILSTGLYLFRFSFSTIANKDVFYLLSVSESGGNPDYTQTIFRLDVDGIYVATRTVSNKDSFAGVSFVNKPYITSGDSTTFTNTNIFVKTTRFGKWEVVTNANNELEWVYVG